jgi:hypothetical protein
MLRGKLAIRLEPSPAGLGRAALLIVLRGRRQSVDNKSHKLL